jgi:hypothetical protein
MHCVEAAQFLKQRETHMFVRKRAMKIALLIAASSCETM